MRHYQSLIFEVLDILTGPPSTSTSTSPKVDGRVASSKSSIHYRTQLHLIERLALEQIAKGLLFMLLMKVARDHYKPKNNKIHVYISGGSGGSLITVGAMERRPVA